MTLDSAAPLHAMMMHASRPRWAANAMRGRINGPEPLHIGPLGIPRVHGSWASRVMPVPSLQYHRGILYCVYCVLGTAEIP